MNKIQIIAIFIANNNKIILFYLQAIDNAMFLGYN